MIFLRNKNRTRLNTINRLTINERLASIGGLFGALSIIITGGLLYAIFTAKSEDKWYYITAVLINVFLLILLMIGAIIFDRYYLKKWASLRAHHHHHQQSQQQHRSNSNSNIITSRNGQTTVHNTESSVHFSQHNNEFLNNIDSFNTSAIMNDIPPQYPGYYPPITPQSTIISINGNNNNSNNNVDSINTVATNAQVYTNNLLNDNSQYVNGTNQSNNMSTSIILIAAQDDMPIQLITNNSENKFNLQHQLPPNYYDLYPHHTNNITKTANINNNTSASIVVSTSNKGDISANNNDCINNQIDSETKIVTENSNNNNNNNQANARSSQNL